MLVLKELSGSLFITLFFIALILLYMDLRQIFGIPVKKPPKQMQEREYKFCINCISKWKIICLNKVEPGSLIDALYFPKAFNELTDMCMYIIIKNVLTTI